MNKISTAILVSFALVCLQVNSTTVLNDYLNGQGAFNTTQQLQYWKVINSTAYTFNIRQPNTLNGYLELNKSDSAQGSYDDGIFYFFGDSQPKHISVQMKTSNPDIESCDMRLTSINTSVTFFFNKQPWQDVAFYRFGYFNYQKLNLVSMVQKFTNDTWYDIDLLIDWDAQAVTVYVDGIQLASDKFFTNQKTKILSANAIVLYNLTPASSCQIRKLKICDDRCSGKESYQLAFAENLMHISMTFVTLTSILVYFLM